MNDNPASNALNALSDFLANTVDSIGRSTVAICGPRRGVASGVVWRPGVLVTVAHVFRRAPAAMAVIAEGCRSVDAALIGIDSTTDIAVFRFPDESIPAPTIGDASRLRAGHLVIAVGRGSSGDVTASYGMVNRTGGAWQSWLGGRIDRLIRLDGGIHQGLSGGLVADASGMVVGVATAALSRSYGMVIPALTVSRVVDLLLSKGHVARAFLGISAQPVPLPKPGKPVDGEAAKTTGLLITSLAAAGPAERSGIMIGDILVRVANQPASDLDDLRNALADHIGKDVTLEVLRGGEYTRLQATVGEWPPERHHRC